MRKLILFIAIAAITAFSVAVVEAQIRQPGWRLPEREPREQIEPLPWDLQAAGHLLRRAGFSASPGELQRIVDQGFEATLDELLDFESIDDSAMEAQLAEREYSLVRLNQNERLRANAQNLQRWWLYRMIHSRHQLVEKMTLFWHDHFATSAQGVNFVNGREEPLVLVQNQTLRSHALGNFKEMVHAIARDPAMIYWLDNLTNVVGEPNENWARELMELFTMGEGNGYTEFDIQEAARAFTGWSVVPPRRRDSAEVLTFAFYPQRHDFEPKTVLGQTIVSQPGSEGVLDGEQVVEIIFEQPQVAEFITAKLWDFFVYAEPPEEIVSQLAEGFRDSGYDLKSLMRSIFEHPHFMSTKAYRAKIKSPVEFMVQAFRELEVGDPDNIPRLSQFLGLGQNLFLPPDVGGWTSDAGWINTGTLLARYNWLNCLTSNREGLDPRCVLGSEAPEIELPGARRIRDQIDVAGIIQENQLLFAVNVVDYFVRALLQDDVTLDTRYALEQYLLTGDDGLPAEFDIENEVTVDKKVRGLIYLVSLQPAYQLN